VQGDFLIWQQAIRTVEPHNSMFQPFQARRGVGLLPPDNLRGEPINKPGGEAWGRA